MNLYNKYKDYTYKNTIKQIINEKYLPIHWGDEVEAHVVYLDKESKTPKLAIDLHYLFEKIKHEKEEDEEDINFSLIPEYGGWMIETTPINPYYTINNFCAVASNLLERH